MEGDRDLVVGILGILAVAQDEEVPLGERLDSHGELPEEWGKGVEERQD